MIKHGDKVRVLRVNHPDKNWAVGLVGYVLHTCEECWAAGCSAVREGHSECSEGNFVPPVVRIPRPKPADAGSWDGYSDIAIAEEDLEFVIP